MNSKEEILEHIEALKEELEELEGCDGCVPFDDFLDEMGEVKIGTLTYSPSFVLKEIDETAYNLAHNEYHEERINEINEELEELGEELEE